MSNCENVFEEIIFVFRTLSTIKRSITIVEIQKITKTNFNLQMDYKRISQLCKSLHRMGYLTQQLIPKGKRRKPIIHYKFSKVIK